MQSRQVFAFFSAWSVPKCHGATPTCIAEADGVTGALTGAWVRTGRSGGVKGFEMLWSLQRSSKFICSRCFQVPCLQSWTCRDEKFLSNSLGLLQKEVFLVVSEKSRAKGKTGLSPKERRSSGPWCGATSLRFSLSPRSGAPVHRQAHNYFLYYDNGKSAVKIPAQGVASRRVRFPA